MGAVSKEEWAADVARIQAEYAARQAEARREYRRQWMARKRQRDRDAKQPSRIVLDIPPDLAEILVSRKPAGLPWPEYLLGIIQTECHTLGLANP
jgi:hypothetical protein